MGHVNAVEHDVVCIRGDLNCSALVLSRSFHSVFYAMATKVKAKKNNTKKVGNKSVGQDSELV